MPQSKPCAGLDCRAEVDMQTEFCPACRRDSTKRKMGRIPTESAAETTKPTKPPAAQKPADSAPPDLLEKIARWLWAKTHPDDEREDCPPDQIPTKAELAAFLGEATEDAHIEASAYLDALLSPAEGQGWHWSVTRSKQDPDLALITAICLTERGELVLAPSYDDEGQPAALGPAVLTLDAVHAVWEAQPSKWEDDDLPAEKRAQPVRPPHPLVPMICAWQDRATLIDPDHRSKPIIGRTLLGRLEREAPPAPTLDMVKVPGLAYQAELFRPERGDVSALIKTLYEIDRGDPLSRQPRAPLAAVLWLEGLLSIPTQHRNGNRYSMGFTRKKLYHDWAGCDPRFFSYRQSRVQDAALDRISNFTVAVGEGWYKPLIVEGVEGPHLNSVVVVSVRLPPEAQQGPAVPRRILRALLKSRLAWLGFLNLCVHLDRYGGRKGHLIAATRPEVKRNQQGQILNHKGEPIRNKRGYPIDRYTDRRAIQTGKRELNPARTQYPTLGKDELIAQFYPLDLPTSSQDVRDKWKATQRALKRISDADGIHIERTPSGWRVMPGPWSFATHDEIRSPRTGLKPY